MRNALLCLAASLILLKIPIKLFIMGVMLRCYRASHKKKLIYMVEDNIVET
jgi:hypothetical protein